MELFTNSILLEMTRHLRYVHSLFSFENPLCSPRCLSFIMKLAQCYLVRVIIFGYTTFLKYLHAVRETFFCRPSLKLLHFIYMLDWPFGLLLEHVVVLDAVTILRKLIMFLLGVCYCNELILLNKEKKSAPLTLQINVILPMANNFNLIARGLCPIHDSTHFVNEKLV